jgi:hypothetical protein
MKRVRYLAGAAGIAPMAVGALGAGTGPATAAVTSPGKTVSLHTASRHQAQNHPDIFSSSWCLQAGFLRVFFLHGFVDKCYGDSGIVYPNLPFVTKIYTGNNGMSASITENGHAYYCNEPFKKKTYYATQCTSIHNGHPTSAGGVLAELRIYPGIA